MLVLFGGDTSFNQAACGKRCYNALKRVMWHNDGPAEDVSSLTVLIDWMTDGDNYERYRGGDAQSGENKTALAQKISRLISQKGIKTVRTAKDITNKIASLESSYRSVVDFLHGSGQGITDETSLRDKILQICPEYYELHDTMNSRVGTRAQLLNTDPGYWKDDTESDGNSSSSETVPQTKKYQKDDLPSQPALLRLKEAQLVHQRDFQHAELGVREQELHLREKEFSAREKQLESEKLLAIARVGEANAQASKLMEEAEHWRQQRRVTLLRERKKLLDEGVSKDEIDFLLPLVSDLEHVR
ncbi:uncharacterized protein PITG_10548 [Phytophthora infestans T30-4]|uniref:Uncharacterized protein n=1 Tax=Phytophthora infestans (strain T30-4) TaxID=403677 RepID=D0NFK8_PHYIT|nr:uncharacterized protein PITG_10548 [Phytophthora infestans T30-4]EEY56997.1 hypothetical protein PITG_10548 [Phytophthora infestans T30-4]|eukprot:XP_002902325.1 hypothetical protein PITG_10548 [Phytophthora infestans T30-4]